MTLDLTAINRWTRRNRRAQETYRAEQDARCRHCIDLSLPGDFVCAMHRRQLDQAAERMRKWREGAT